MSSVTDLLGQLIRIPSVNPEGDPGTRHTGEEACAKFLRDFLGGNGAEAWLQDVLPNRPNVVAKFPSDRAGKPRLLFAPHTDTVSVAGMTIDPFGGVSREGKIWGRGASDTKGPMAAMLCALVESADILPRLSHEIWFAGLMGEEAGQHGSRALAEAEKFDFVVVGEPTSLRTVHAHKGSVWLTLRARGKSVHASMPDKGRNAIQVAMDAWAWMRGEFDARFSGLSHEVLGRTTINLGTIEGGSKVNIVPDFCEACIDIRTLPGQDIESFVESFRRKFPEVELLVKNSRPLYTDPSHPVIGVLEDCGATRAGAPWFCDAAVFAEAGVPSIALGPGSISQAHTADEWITIADLEAGVAFFKKFLQRLSVS